MTGERMMEPLTNELKETIIREHSDGVWLVLAQEYPPDIVTAYDLLCRKHKAEVIPFPRPRASDQSVVNPVLIDLELRGADVGRIGTGIPNIREADAAK